MKALLLLIEYSYRGVKGNSIIKLTSKQTKNRSKDYGVIKIYSYIIYNCSSTYNFHDYNNFLNSTIYVVFWNIIDYKSISKKFKKDNI
ncbi:hypothetical protein HZS_5411 [Henneguya salminicola]|nr:hypothetical protein HZS_5411 [Henneguya salminicola]